MCCTVVPSCCSVSRLSSSEANWKGRLPYSTHVMLVGLRVCCGSAAVRSDKLAEEIRGSWRMCHELQMFSLDDADDTAAAAAVAAVNARGPIISMITRYKCNISCHHQLASFRHEFYSYCGSSCKMARKLWFIPVICEKIRTSSTVYLIENQSIVTMRLRCMQSQ